MNAMDIVPMTRDHWPAVREIFAQGIASGNATFETSVPDWPAWDAHHLPVCRLVAQDAANVLGWAALSQVSTRYVYRGVSEVSIYVAARARGRGVGIALLAALVAESEKNGIWTLQSVIHADNSTSIRLHQRAGFRIVGRRERIGWLNGRWRDTVLMERRSGVVGV
jgi:L-amino acid N-acyltransferase YncA